MTASAAGDGDGRRLQGGCRCGAVRYDVADEFAYSMNCH